MTETQRMQENFKFGARFVILLINVVKGTRELPVVIYVKELEKEN
jgi:hypothetical protein